MKLFDSDDNKCYLVSQAGATKDIDRISVVGYQKIIPGEAYPKEGFPDTCLFQEHGGRYISEYQLIFIASGGGIFQDRGIHYNVEAGQFLLIQPGYWHSYAPDINTGWEEYYIGFNGPTLSALSQDLFKSTNINHLKVANSEFVLPLYLTALKHGQEITSEGELIIKALLINLITELRFCLLKNNTDESLIFKTRQFMEENLSKKISIDDIANYLCVSNSWFRKEFYKETGVAPITFLNRIRLQTSKYMLLSTNKSIKEISIHCGFATSEYFCKFFKNNTGITPGEYRVMGPV